MKVKKQNYPNNPANKKNNNHIPSSAPLNKEFELMYRSIDRMPSSEQMQSVIFVKRKKISPTDQLSSSPKKNRKKTQNSKKKKIEEKHQIDQIYNLPFKKKDSFQHTKTTMPSSTQANFKKSSFADTFKQKINLEKSGIRKLNNNCNSNSSRYLASKYLNKEQKSPHKKKAIPKSPNKITSPVHKNIKSPNKSSQLQSKYSHRLKNLKSKVQENHKIIDKKTRNPDCEYVFLDGEYIQVQNPVSQMLTQKMMTAAKLEKEKSANQFIEGFEKFKENFDHRVCPSDQPQFLQEEQENEFTRSENYHYFLENIIFIQRWWRECLRSKEIQKCNNKMHCTSKAQSEQQISQSRISPKTQDEENTHQIHQIEQSGVSNFSNFIEIKEKLLESELKSQKQILTKLFELNKIDHITFSNSLTKVEANFQKQILQISKLKQKIEAETAKTQQLKMKLKEKNEIIDDLQNIPTNIILQHFFTKPESQSLSKVQEESEKVNYKRQKSTGCHYATLSENDSNTKAVSYRKSDQSHKQDVEITSPLSLHNKELENEKQSGENEKMQMSISQQALSSIFTIYNDRQEAQAQIQKRYAIQLGMGFLYGGQKNGTISTSVISIHNFLMNFLKFYEYFYKDEFLKLINLPYGLNQSSRMKKLQGYDGHNWKRASMSSDDAETFFEIESIIGSQILEDFQEHSFQLPQTIDDVTKAAVYFQKIHQRAIIDCFNQSLNCFRPYYFIGGAPYSWNYSEKALTFYYIAEQNIQEVFQKTQYKVLKNASCICGTIVEPLIKSPQITPEMELQEKLAKYRESISQVLAESRDEKLGKVQKTEIEQHNYKWEYFEQQKTSIMFDVANFIFEELIFEVLLLKPVGNLREGSIESGSQKSLDSLPSTQKSTPQRLHNKQYYLQTNAPHDQHKQVKIEKFDDQQQEEYEQQDEQQSGFCYQKQEGQNQA